MGKPKSRRERFAEAIASVEMAMADIQSLRDELQDWLDNMPDNLQTGQKAEELEGAVANLEDVLDSLETATSTDVEFPGMY